MTLQVVQALSPSLAGSVITQTAVAATDTIAVNLAYRYVLMVVNGGGSPDNVVITPSATDAFGRTVATQTVTVSNGTTQFIHLPNQVGIANASTGLITITHSFTTSVTCAVIGIPVGTIA